jgi:hypothetical protein
MPRHGGEDPPWTSSFTINNQPHLLLPTSSSIDIGMCLHAIEEPSKMHDFFFGKLMLLDFPGFS